MYELQFRDLKKNKMTLRLSSRQFVEFEFFFSGIDVVDIKQLKYKVGWFFAEIADFSDIFS